MAENKQTVIQSFLPYPHRVPLFKDDGKPMLGADGNQMVIRIPALRESPKNILVTTEDVLLKLMGDKSFSDFEKMGMKEGVKILEEIPTSYWSAQEQVAAVMARESMAKAEAEKLQALADAKDAEIAELKNRLAGFGAQA